MAEATVVMLVRALKIDERQTFKHVHIVRTNVAGQVSKISSDPGPMRYENLKDLVCRIIF
jgi:hypothetical protein